MNEYIFTNESSDEDVLGDADVYKNVGAAEQYFEHWVSEEPSMRFYTARGERLVAIEHGDLRRTFHFEKTGTIYAGFDNLVKQEARRRGLSLPEFGFSTEDVLHAMWEQSEKFTQENQGCLTLFLPPRAFREKYGFWSWYLPFLRKEPSE